ncbi:hypothetical protein EE612_005843 [Oryza sativa]|nr:hypothetical protein EE612_005843 [Oryza sativa]
MDTIRCCIACILPCGALDVVRIVHSNGRVEEISGPVLAGEIMKAYPKHAQCRAAEGQDLLPHAGDGPTGEGEGEGEGGPSAGARGGEEAAEEERNR